MEAIFIVSIHTKQGCYLLCPLPDINISPLRISYTDERKPIFHEMIDEQLNIISKGVIYTKTDSLYAVFLFQYSIGFSY